MRTISYLLVSIVLSGCAGTGQYLDKYTLKSLDKPLLRDASVSIQIPQNGSHKRIVYQESGRKTAAAFKTEFDRYASSTKLIEDCSWKACLEAASQDASSYFVGIEIVHWEERQTAWSGKRDRMTLKIAVYDVTNGRELTSTFLQGASTANSFGGDHAEDMLPDIVSPYVSSLYVGGHHE